MSKLISAVQHTKMTSKLRWDVVRPSCLSTLTALPSSALSRTPPTPHVRNVPLSCAAFRVQIMRAHKSDDGDRAGKRIASEADRRYIMTSAETKRDAKAAGKVSAAGGPASTGGGRTGSSTVGSPCGVVSSLLYCDALRLAK